MTRDPSKKREKRIESDLMTIAKVALVVVALGTVLEIVACVKNDDSVPTHTETK